MHLRRILEGVVEEVAFALGSGRLGGLSQMQTRAVGGGGGGGAKGGGASMNKYREGRDGTGIFKNGKCNLKCSGS